MRCCMCPNINKPETECPAGKQCKFVKVYHDDRGWVYRVMPGLGDTFKGRYRKPGTGRWKCMTNLSWQETFDQAQTDLNALAEKKGWRVNRNHI